MGEAGLSRLTRGGAVFIVASVALATLMAAPRVIGFGIGLGFGLVAVAALGALHAAGLLSPVSTTTGAPPAARSGFPWGDAAVIALGALLYLPMLGAGGLWDPWETHYGEVARRMLERDDWISMWWENEWFYSKPVLVMWLQALGMALVGSNPYPDGQLFGSAWGMRLPILLFAIFCLWGVYHFVSRLFGKRAGLLSAVALATMPQFFFLSHQTMTDMPYVASMTVALCFVGAAMAGDDDRLATGPTLRVPLLGTIELGPAQALYAALIVCVLPQALYLLTRPMRFESGSAGQENVDLVDQVVPVPLAVVGLATLGGFAWLLWSLRNERRVRRLYIVAAYLLLGLSVLAKVLPGLVLAAAVLACYLAVTGRWSELRKLELVRGTVTLCVVCLPWYLAMVVRHGQPFIDRILFHDIVNRAVVGVHGDTGTIDYFVRQLGYSTFPWLALVPLAVFGFLWHDDRDLGTPRGRARALALIWLVVSFVFFSGVITKFHHYIFPALVPLAILIGVALDDLATRRALWPAPLLVAGVGLLAVVGRDLSGGASQGTAGHQILVNLFTYKYDRRWPEGPDYDFSATLGAFAIAAVLLAIPLTIPRLRRPMIAAQAVLAFLFAAWALDVYMPRVGLHWSQERIIRRYYELRAGPEERLVAYQMNWKGENFYTGNRVVVRVDLDTADFERWVESHRGQRHFFMTEASRFESMRSAINRAAPQAGTRLREIGRSPGPGRPSICNKFRMGVTTL